MSDLVFGIFAAIIIILLIDIARLLAAIKKRLDRDHEPQETRE